jgi:hypothetical protein
MLRLFSAGLVATLVYVLAGVVRQYLIAAQLPVADVGFYGTWVARASLLLVLIPFPAYLDVLIKGFSAVPDEQAHQRQLAAGVRRELMVLGACAAIVLIPTFLHALVSHQLNRGVVALLLLLLAQYVNATADILLRMIQAHRRFAVFMALRNLPSLVLVASLGVQSSLAVVLTDVAQAAFVWWFVFRSRPLRAPTHPLLQPFWRMPEKEQITLGIARLFQFVSTSLLRIGVPLAFSAHDTGLFFFACLAQTPGSVFLSVGNQLFGHSLARLQRGEMRKLLRIQLWYATPNLLYAIVIALLVPYWNVLIDHVPTLGKYRDIGALVFAVALHSAVLSSDCQEFLLRTRGLSIVLLRYYIGSILVQGTCLLAAYELHLSPANTIILCAAALAANLTGFSLYSFNKAVGASVLHGSRNASE